MATVITSECINCGACEPECPNTAIYQGGVEWELDGATHPAISNDIFYIVPEKCTECVGFYDHEACAAVCPVDCCVPDPERPESEAVLLERAKTLHPEATFGPDFPSRFKKEGGAAAAPAASPAPAAPQPTAAASGPAAAPAPSAAAPAAALAAVPTAEVAVALPPLEEWEVPIHCFRCQGDFTVPFQYLRAGTVFYCPHCQGSFVPTIPLCQAVDRALRGFYDTVIRRAEEFHERRQRELDRFEDEQHRHLEAFQQRLRELSESVKAPGAPHKKRSFFGL
jgi:ferredoxin